MFISLLEHTMKVIEKKVFMNKRESKCDRCNHVSLSYTSTLTLPSIMKMWVTRTQLFDDIYY